MANTGFAASIELLPKLNCMGRVSSVGEAHITASGTYARIPMTIDPIAGGQKGFIGFLFHPSWLVPGFNPESLAAEPNGKTLQIVYKLNVSCSNQPSLLQGVAGTAENFGTLAAQIQGAIEGLKYETPDEQAVFISTVRDVIAEFVQEVAPEVGYFLVQKLEDSGELKPNGSKLKLPVAGKREVGGFFLPSVSAHKRNEADAAKQKSIMAYDPASV